MGIPSTHSPAPRLRPCTPAPLHACAPARLHPLRPHPRERPAPTWRTRGPVVELRRASQGRGGALVSTSAGRGLGPTLLPRQHDGGGHLLQTVFQHPLLRRHTDIHAELRHRLLQLAASSRAPLIHLGLEAGAARVCAPEGVQANHEVALPHDTLLARLLGICNPNDPVFPRPGEREGARDSSVMVPRQGAGAPLRRKPLLRPDIRRMG